VRLFIRRNGSGEDITELGEAFLVTNFGAIAGTGQTRASQKGSVMVDGSSQVQYGADIVGTATGDEEIEIRTLGWDMLTRGAGT